MTRGFSQLYLSLGDPNPDGSLAVRLYYKPLVLLIWLGAVVMVIGGALSLSDRRLRVGAPKPARSKAALAAGGVDRYAVACVSSCVGADARRPSVRRRFAVQPDEILSDAALEARARALSKELRCMVCQNQSIDDSDAPLARDLRILVRERLQAGDSDQQVIDFLVARYGEFVLLRPRFSWHTALLWLGSGGHAARSGQSALFMVARRYQTRSAIPTAGECQPRRETAQLGREARGVRAILRLRRDA